MTREEILKGSTAGANRNYAAHAAIAEAGACT